MWDAHGCGCHEEREGGERGGHRRRSSSSASTCLRFSRLWYSSSLRSCSVDTNPTFSTALRSAKRRSLVSCKSTSHERAVCWLVGQFGVGANERGGGRTQDLHKFEQAHLSTWMHATQQRLERCSLHAPAHMMRNNNLEQLLPLAYAAAPQSRGVRTGQ